MKPFNALVALLFAVAAITVASLLATDNQPIANANSQAIDEKADEMLVSLGINNNEQVTESSGLANSTFTKNSIWTLNDSGHSNDLLLLNTDGTLQASVSINGATNVDWEAMAGFKLGATPYLLVADVGDNLKRRKIYQLYLVREPDLSAKLKIANAKLPLKTTVDAITIQFTYEDGPKNCEAIGVDLAAKEVWLVEKIYYDDIGKTQPGIYTLPISLPPDSKPQVAKRIASFPPRNVTGMGFSPDGKMLIIRNYLNAHLYSRADSQNWQEVVNSTKPKTVVLPLQRQGEAICFTKDSKSVILTSELKRQPIWQVSLRPYVDRTTGDAGNTMQDKLKAPE